ncbi:MAG: bifunctional UDP-N-acetylglucosamine diphosphorylase/glucosamine-1-phosphate N-acetyltransferase GlmU [Anaerolineales bacterium]|nr:bifunctional UDP-N-acetylglucosamine diphosphorylase/glucosamine-1-phosphate N-acetyltransferase GlmU [Anaerolineales bacterium]
MRITPVLLAAGQGTRMKSDLPKVLHPILGKPLAWYALQAAQAVSSTRPVVVIGHGAEQVRATLGAEIDYVVQPERLGTGHAVQQTAALLAGQTDLVLVTYADMPLLRVETLQRLVEAQLHNPGVLSMLTNISADPRGFGRVVRDQNGQIQAIVEEVDATPAQLAIRELNTGVYCFAADWLWQAIPRIQLSSKGEYFLTDLASIARQDGHDIQAVTIEDDEEIIGINTRVHLAEASQVMQRRINQSWMLAGVTLVDPAATYIEPGVVIGPDTTIWPNTHLQGSTRIGKGCSIGPNTIVQDTQVGDRCKVLSSVLEQAHLEIGVEIGPFGHLRKGAHLAEGVHMGNFGEVKNSYLGPGTKMGHFSYLGDATIGANVNIGAGTITCNYDGKNKNPTEIGDDVFIGSDTMLVAPVTLGKGARTGAGSVVTKDVSPDTLVVGVPARPIRKLE